ncbi:MAG: bifunctional 4-hydroxy-2-oxoglutarate aldolase/2-dehydro-3-deoxy-phosphogluconate aldolase [Spirochaetes bacterium]|jgi:2-dehydro-3-deoxyphosphogluconate aldolase/(4S)-4-hydroxy-2-oxoglutarate aldolase|nr:bifunctional 4-hydroxy-2-oxoglutarate aldolase/2-dehydro-3-deoxy-phosphogluconate aldolase [Spirochaetota bacterium]
MDNYSQVFTKHKIIPVVVVEREEQALRLADLLVEQNLPIMEITFRSAAAAGAISSIRKEFPDMVVGAGTLTTRDSVLKAIGSGAGFFVAPGFNPKIVEFAKSHGKDLIPGVSNPSLVEQAMEYDLKLLKFFPAEDAGKTGMLKAFASVYPDTKFIPTGGINAANILDYLALPNVLCCGGSWLVSPKLVRDQKWEELRVLIRDAAKLVG